MADWTAITGIVVSGLLGPAAAAWLAERRARREHEYARILSDRVELRQFLGEAEQALRLAERIASAIPWLLLTHGHWLPERADSHIKKFNEAMRELDLHSSQLALRIGSDHEATRLYEEAFGALVGVSVAIDRLRVEGDTAPSVQQANTAIQAGHSKAAGAHEQFLASANKLVASQLEPRKRDRCARLSRVAGPQPGPQGADKQENAP